MGQDHPALSAVGPGHGDEVGRLARIGIARRAERWPRLTGVATRRGRLLDLSDPDRRRIAGGVAGHDRERERRDASSPRRPAVRSQGSVLVEVRLVSHLHELARRGTPHVQLLHAPGAVGGERVHDRHGAVLVMHHEHGTAVVEEHGRRLASRWHGDLVRPRRLMPRFGERPPQQAGREPEDRERDDRGRHARTRAGAERREPRALERAVPQIGGRLAVVQLRQLAAVTVIHRGPPGGSRAFAGACGHGTGGRGPWRPTSRGASPPPAT